MDGRRSHKIRGTCLEKLGLFDRRRQPVEQRDKKRRRRYGMVSNAVDVALVSSTVADSCSRWKLPGRSRRLLASTQTEIYGVIRQDL